MFASFSATKAAGGEVAQLFVSDRRMCRYRQRPNVNKGVTFLSLSNLITSIDAIGWRTSPTPRVANIMNAIFEPRQDYKCLFDVRMGEKWEWKSNWIECIG